VFLSFGDASTLIGGGIVFLIGAPAAQAPQNYHYTTPPAFCQEEILNKNPFLFLPEFVQYYHLQSCPLCGIISIVKGRCEEHSTEKKVSKKMKLPLDNSPSM
jgi:hypothetical protein